MYYECDERRNGFITNFDYSIRRVIAYRIAGYLHRETVQIIDNATDVYNNPVANSRALYMPGAGDLTKFWNTVRKIEKFLRVK